MSGVLALVDFSDVTEAVVEQATRLAERLQTELLLLHVAAPEPDFIGYAAGPQTVRDTVAGELRREHRELRRLEDHLKSRGLKVTALCVQGPILEKSLSEIRRWDPELVVMGSHGHGLLRNLLVGSVTEGILRRAHCPVMVVPSRRS